MKKIIYTAIFGEHDYVKDPYKLSDDWDYVLFTDDPDIQSDYWEVRHVTLDELGVDSAVAAARKIKTQVHKFLDFDTAIWVDGSVFMFFNPEGLIQIMNGLRQGKDGKKSKVEGRDLMFKAHPQRNNVFEEVKACIDLGKAPKEKLTAQGEAYSMKFDLSKDEELFPLIETQLFCFHRTEKTEKLFDLWWSEIEQYGNYRDQISLPFALKQMDLRHDRDVLLFGQKQFEQIVALCDHIKEDVPDVNLIRISPYALNGNLGRAYNDAVSGYNDDDWILITDGDAMFMDGLWGLKIARVIQDNPDYDIFGCMTNRLMDTPQLHEGKRSDNPSMEYHKLVSELRWEKHGTKVKEVQDGKPIAGLFMLMKKSTLADVKFKNGLNKIDTDFGLRAMKKGYKMGIAKGVYMMHYYRLNEGHFDVTHLLSPQQRMERANAEKKRRLAQD